MKHADFFWLAAALAVLAAGCGQEGGPNGPSSARAAEPTPRYADQDRNGRVTRREAATDPALAANFDRYDANADGTLDRAEFARLEAGAEPGTHPPLRPRDEYARPGR